MKAEGHYSEKKQSPVLKSRDPLSAADKQSARQGYLAYQKEVQADKIVPGDEAPKSPGKILKLPLDEK